jgi:hypothetical protein
VIYAYAAKDVSVLFVMPDTTQRIELQVGDANRETNKIALDLKARVDKPDAQANSRAGAARQYPVELEAGAEIRAGSNRYEILSAELESYSSGNLAARFKVRVSHDSSGAINVWESTFRLYADGVPLAPTEAPNEVLEANSSIDVDVLFVIPESTTSIELQVGEVGRETSRIPINL